MRFLRVVAGVIVILGVLAAVVEARTVYLRDGAVLECESIRRQGATVIVTVNRDTVLRFAAAEVDLRRTFPRQRVGRDSRHTAVNTVSRERGARTSPVAAAPVADRSAAPAGEVTRDVPPVASPVRRPAAVDTAPAATAPEPPRVTAAPEHTAVSPPPVAAPVVPPSVPHLAGRVAPGTLAGLGIAVLLLVVLLAAAHWRLYEKAGVAGWKCLVPLYNLYLLVLIAGKPWWWFLLLFVPVVSVAVYLVMMLALAERFGKGPLYGIGLFFLPFICFPLLAFDRSEFRGVKPVA